MQRIPSDEAAGLGRLTIELNEWSEIDPGRNPRLKNLSFEGHADWRALAESLRGKIEVYERYDGISIKTKSFVGRVDVGPLHIVVRPKLPAMPLTRLLRYAYGLRDLRLIEETRSPMHEAGMHDLVVALLAGEVEELLYRGLLCRYVATEERLTSPRGQILVDRIIRRGGVLEAALPCRHHDRRKDWSLNRVLRAGLDHAARMTEDRELRRRVQKLTALFGDVGEMVRLKIEDVDRVERALTRMTEASQPALTLIRLLLDMQGVEFETPVGSNKTPGFLFDMNLFFERLLSRFLGEHVTDARMFDQQAIRGMFVYAPEWNVAGRKAPSPRPDYALSRGKELLGFYDAKYRELWRRTLPHEWLYQLTIYALAAPSERSVLLYASMEPAARDEKIEIQRPLAGASRRLGSVILRPVPLQTLAALLAPGDDSERLLARRRFAQRLTSASVEG
jgi:5-methylcytosine-specific restriction enzyme subunit McrC